MLSFIYVRTCIRTKMCSPAALEGGDVEGGSRAVENDYSCIADEDDVSCLL